ncbi:MAG: Eco57I restriction-modification methylase domain-containing protein, partial [Bacteroidota bacterium]
AVVGNPPWEIQKPNSKEFFSNIDPLYRTYGKQEALDKQSEYFQRSADDERDWLVYCARLKALSNWVKNAGFPFGDGEEGSATFGIGRSDSRLLDEWRARRAARTGYADPEHAFRHQGSADINTYKMFLEQAHALLRKGGRMGLVVPSGVYSDKGASDLRKLFLTRCRWEWLFGFENRDEIFDIHRSFKFCPIIVQKGGETESIQTAFMRRNLADWEEGERYAIPYARAQVERFSPNSRAILEIRNRRDLEILEKIYANSVLLGDKRPGGWQITYATEFHMTNDSHLFPPRPWWEAQGYRPDEYCRWLKGLWHEGRPAGPRWEMEPGVILSVDGTAWIHEDEIEDVALPLYEGRMIGQFDFSQKGWVRGKGRSAVWREIPWEAKVIEPQFLVPLAAFRTFRENRGLDVERHLSRIGFIDVASATNIRSMLSTPLHAVPCGNTVPVLESAQRPGGSAWLAAVLNSFCYDFALRARLGGLHLNWFVVDETPVQARKTWTASSVVLHACQLSLCHQCFAALWSDLGFALTRAWRHLWAVTKHERLRLRCLLDAVMAELYGLDWDDLAWILRECDYPVEMLRDTAFTRTLDPKGFWRVDKDKDPELRHTVLTLVAFRDLKQLIASEGDRDRGIEAFCALNNGEGWMLPETLRLADLGLGHDERAKRAQPVRERLGERFLSWQLEATPEESWRECRLHARNFLGEEGYKKLMKELDAARGDKADGLSATPTEEARSEASEVSGEAEWPALAAESHPPYEAGTVVGSTQLTLFPSGQKNLFGGNAAGIPSKRNRRRR